MIHKGMTQLTVTEFAEVLFSTTLRASDHPSSAAVWAAVRRSWIAGGGDSRCFAAQLAQEAGDHPEQAASRMRWALQEAESILHRPRMQLAG